MAVPVYIYSPSSGLLPEGVGNKVRRRLSGKRYDALFWAPFPITATREIESSRLQREPLSVGSLLWAGGLILTGALTHYFPSQIQAGKRFLVSTDWKIWARVLLGVLSVHKANKAFNFQPPPWFGALEAVAIINPLALGFSRRSFAQMAVMAPIVAAMVQGASIVHKRLADPLKEQWGIPKLVTRLGLSVVLAFAGVKLYPGLFKSVAKSGILGKSIRLEAENGMGVMAGSTMMTCARGCTPGSVICMSEMGEMFGGMGTWFKSHFEKQKGGEPS